MLRVNVRSRARPALSYLEVQEGNIDFGGSVRCVVSLHAEDGEVLESVLWSLSGHEFDQWLARPDGHKATVDKVLKFCACERA